MLLCLAGCVPMKTTASDVHRHYSTQEYEAIIKDEKLCGPAAKQAVEDWSVGITPDKAHVGN